MRILLALGVLLVLQATTYGQVRDKARDTVQLEQLYLARQADSTRGNYLSAIKHLKQYSRLKDSVRKAAEQEHLAKLQLQYQTAKKDGELLSREKNIGLLTVHNQLTIKNLQQTKYIRQIVAAVAAIVALLLFISYLQYRLKRRANNRLLQQQQAIDQKNQSLQQLASQKDDLLEEKELLIKEIHHRVKNNLQVVISLLNTQSAYLNDPQATAAIRQSQHRMQSISLIHQKLYQSESRALINMKEYTHELVQYLQQNFETAGRIDFKLDIDEIDLDVLRAVPIGLILNEAITNSIKYAFGANTRGLIAVMLSCIGGNQLRLAVTDNGNGLPAAFNLDPCKSLGINLIKGMCRQINGQLAIGNKKGLVITIEFPIEEALVSSIDELSSFDDKPQVILSS